MSGSIDRQAPPPREVREAAIATLTAAYGDGQLTLEEYDERVAGVLAADNAWRLERWINDLQQPSVKAPAPPRPRRSAFKGLRRPWEELRQDWARYPRTAKVAIAALALAVSGTLVGGVVYEAVRDDSSVVAEQRLTSGLGDFRTEYEAEFGTTTVGDLQIDPGYVRVAEPVEDDPPRFQGWAFQNGSFSEVGGVRGGPPGVVDLALVDVAAVEATLNDAVAELGVPEASKVTTIISPPGAGQEQRITLLISNDFAESARLTTDFAGQELTRQPFVEPGEG